MNARRDGILMKDKVVEDLTQVICTAIDDYRLSQCEMLTVGQILQSLERIRFGLTERLIQRKVKT